MIKIIFSLVLLVIASSLVFGIPMTPQVFAQYASPNSSTGSTITTSVDKSSYTIDDTIVISGRVQQVMQGTPLVIQISDPSNNIVQVAQIDVSQDGEYVDTIKAVGPYWKSNGIYTVNVQYGPPNISAQTTFSFQSTPVVSNSVFQLQDPNSKQIFNINYAISGGTVKTMTIDAQSLSVIVSINSTSDGTITLQLPRALIDSKTTSGQDDAFIILIDGGEVKPQSESVDNNFRNVTIQFLQGDHDIEIIGSQVSSYSSSPPSSSASTSQAPVIPQTQNMPKSVISVKGVDTGSPQIVEVSSGDQTFGPVTLNFAYEAPFDIIKPSSLKPGQTGSITLIPSKEKMLVTVSFMGKQFQQSIDLPFGNQVPVPLTTGLTAYAAVAAAATPQVTGPATISSSLQWQDNSMQKIDIKASDNAKNGDQIQVEVPVNVVINGGLNIDLQVLKYNLIQKQIGEFQGDKPITITIPVVVESNTENLFSNSLMYVLIAIIGVLVAVIVVIFVKRKPVIR